jgi:hypothetical protein
MHTNASEEYVTHIFWVKKIVEAYPSETCAVSTRAHGSTSQYEQTVIP